MLSLRGEIENAARCGERPGIGGCSTAQGGKVLPSLVSLR
jgi:hypothetical protein